MKEHSSVFTVENFSNAVSQYFLARDNFTTGTEFE